MRSFSLGNKYWGGLFRIGTNDTIATRGRANRFMACLAFIKMEAGIFRDNYFCSIVKISTVFWSDITDYLFSAFMVSLNTLIPLTTIELFLRMFTFLKPDFFITLI